MRKFFLLSSLSVFFGLISLVFYASQAYAKPPFEVPPIGGLPVCMEDLDLCNSDLDICDTGLAACEAAGSFGVPQTGQTTCWSSAGSVIVCAGTGQDGEVQAGVVPPNPRFTDNGDGTITDNLTGLIWLKDANCFGIQIWAQALTVANTLNSGECGLLDGSVEGDWYLPNRNELTSLLDLENFNPALPTGHPFMNFVSSFYRSSTTSADTPGGAWVVDFGGGGVDFIGKTGDFFVLPVRGGS